MHRLMEQDAKDILLEISESQAVHDLWSQAALTAKTKQRSNTIDQHRPSSKKHKEKKSRIETDCSLTSREANHPPKASQLKIGQLVCYDTLKILDECRPAFSQRIQPYCKSSRVDILGRSKKEQPNTANSTAVILLPNVNDYSSEEKTLKARILQNALVTRKAKWEHQPAIKASYYKKFSKYNTSVLRHEHWGDFVMHLPSVVDIGSKTNCIR